MHLDTISEFSYMSRTSELINPLTASKPRIPYMCHDFKLRRNFGNFEKGLTTGEPDCRVLKAELFADT